MATVGKRRVHVMLTNGRMLLVLFGVASMGVSGCASVGGGGLGALTEEALIVQTLMKWKVGLETLDPDSFLAAYSDRYEGEDGVDKDALIEVIAKTMDGIEVDIEGAEISVDGSSAEVIGVYADGPEGDELVNFALVKEEDGVWRIIRDIE